MEGGSDKGEWTTFYGSIVLLPGSITRGPMLVGLTLTNAWVSDWVKYCAVALVSAFYVIG